MPLNNQNKSKKQLSKMLYFSLLFHYSLFCFSSLMDLEMARDDLLMELHRQPQQSPTDKNVSLYFAPLSAFSLFRFSTLFQPDFG